MMEKKKENIENNGWWWWWWVLMFQMNKYSHTNKNSQKKISIKFCPFFLLVFFICLFIWIWYDHNNRSIIGNRVFFGLYDGWFFYYYYYHVYNIDDDWKKVVAILNLWSNIKQKTKQTNRKNNCSRFWFIKKN